MLYSLVWIISKSQDKCIWDEIYTDTLNFHHNNNIPNYKGLSDQIQISTEMAW